jgi:hypothetical protein
MGITTTRRPLNMNIHGFAILDLKPPVAIETMPRNCPQEHRALLHSLATGIGYALDQATDAWTAAFATVGPVAARGRMGGRARLDRTAQPAPCRCPCRCAARPSAPFLKGDTRRPVVGGVGMVVGGPTPTAGHAR